MPLEARSPFAIETDAEAEEQRDDLVELLKVSHPAFKAIAYCDYDDPCGLSACPLCRHRFRKDTLPALAQLFNQPLDQLRFVTMYVCAVDEGKLAEVNALTHLGTLGKIIGRADIAGRGLAVGALEPEWLGTERKWLIHLHVIAVEVDKNCWTRVRAALRKRANNELRQACRSQARRVLRNDIVSELDRQLSYCIKFVTYDFLPRKGNGAKGAAVPLKGAPLEELVDWRSRYWPGDFLFLYGAKRQNGKLVRMPPRAKHKIVSKRRPISTASPASTGNLAMRKARARVGA